MMSKRTALWHTTFDDRNSSTQWAILRWQPSRCHLLDQQTMFHKAKGFEEAYIGDLYVFALAGYD